MPAYPIDVITNLAAEINIDQIYVDIPFQHRKDIPNKRGVYILKNIYYERYIGKANNIRQRQSGSRSHINIIKNNIKTIDIYLIEDIAYTEILEGRLIRKLEPELNKTGNPAYYRKFGNKKWKQN